MNKKIYKCIKRLADIILSFIGIIVAAIPMLIVSLCIKLESKGDAIFKQERIGRNGKPFTIYKFRSMVVNEKQDAGFSVASDNRITNVGKFIRRYKIDEIPQLFNVLIGDMSFVGPRPYVYNDFKYNKEEELKVLDGIRPGVTGLASFIYKHENYILESVDNKTEYYREVLLKDKSKLNLEYKENLSFILDMKIVFATLKLIDGIRVSKNKPIYYPASERDIVKKNKKHKIKKEIVAKKQKVVKKAKVDKNKEEKIKTEKIKTEKSKVEKNKTEKQTKKSK
ncbi:MAG: sugar transferase [Clostridia bacterium]